MNLDVDRDYLLQVLAELLSIPSPTGYTDAIVHFMGEELGDLGIPFELTRRGAIRADLKGEQTSPDRALVAHVDTLGAMVTELKGNGRLAVAPIGTWSSRFAEGARVSIFTDAGAHRGTVLPLLASGHTYGDAIDTQPVAWDQLEIRVDEPAANRVDLERSGFHPGDYVAFDTNAEFHDNGYINARHLDDKAGVAILLAVGRAVRCGALALPVDCHLLFTISEEVGSGASGILHQDVASMVAVDNATPAPGQNSRETGVTIAMMDSSGPFDYHLTHKLIELCGEHAIPHQRDVFRHYRCDAASAIEAGNDLRTALVCYGVDASHGYERTHADSLLALGRLLLAYLQTPPDIVRDRKVLGGLEGFPTQPTE